MLRLNQELTMSLRRRCVRTMRLVALAFVSAWLFACDGGDETYLPPIETLQYGPYKTTCYSFFFSTCPVATDVGSVDYRGSSPGIEGFTWEWGYVTVVEYRQYPIEDPPQDSWGFTRRLERVVSQEPVDANYEFLLNIRVSDPFRRLSDARDEDYFLTKVSDGLYQYFDITIACEDQALCEELDDIIDMDLNFAATFRFTPPNTLPLILQSIECTQLATSGEINCARTAAL